MQFLPLIEAKRDGRTLAVSDLQEIVAAYTAQAIPDYQMAAFLMAVFFRGLDPTETAALTLAMRDSGEVLRFPSDPRPLVDKHSTGGVGDKVSLPLTPLLACLGFRVPMISGRGLGITGGTLDKLESIPGFTTALPSKRIIELVQEVGCVICGQTDRMVPADKRLYALRDVTGTVPSIPLIVASILSKKLAEGLEALVLDVKFGAAAFMPTLEKARELARAMVALGNQCGVRTRALLTQMDAPLGRSAGNWLEVKEAVACLEAGPGRGQLVPGRIGSPSGSEVEAAPITDDLTDLVLACAAQMLVLCDPYPSVEAAHGAAAACLASGAPRRKWDEMLAAQGADLPAFYDRLALDPTAPAMAEVKALSGGFITACDARVIGEVVRALGGGRLTKDDVVHHAVGVDRLAKPGERVTPGSLLARVHGLEVGQVQAACSRIQAAFVISDGPPTPASAILEVLS